MLMIKMLAIAHCRLNCSNGESAVPRACLRTPNFATSPTALCSFVCFVWHFFPLMSKIYIWVLCWEPASEHLTSHLHPQWLLFVFNLIYLFRMKLFMISFPSCQKYIFDCCAESLPPNAQLHDFTLCSLYLIYLFCMKLFIIIYNFPSFSNCQKCWKWSKVVKNIKNSKNGKTLSKIVKKV